MGQEIWRGKRAFVVEDEAMVSMLIEDALEEMGCIVAATASNLDDALTMAEVVATDFAILDLNLDGRLAFAVADKLVGRSVPVIISTGYGDKALPERFRDLPILNKPFRARELEQAFVTALQSKG